MTLEILFKITVVTLLFREVCPAAIFAYARPVLQIVFNEISAAEISQLDTLEQLALLDEFKVTQDDLEHLDDERFGRIERDGKTLYRFRSQEWRFYFEVVDDQVVVHRVLHRGTFSDFLFRSKLPMGEDEALAESKHFWNLIDEGRQARRS
jgi:mRNA-degrading endonuclease RelE of RelBE toxin-antitoxin system